MRWISPVISPSDLAVTLEKVGVRRISIWITGTVGNATLYCSCADWRRLNSNWSGWRVRRTWCTDGLGWCRRSRRAIAVNIEPIWTSASLSLCTLTISQISMAFLIFQDGSENKKIRFLNKLPALSLSSRRTKPVWEWTYQGMLHPTLPSGAEPPPLMISSPHPKIILRIKIVLSYLLHDP